MLQEIEKLVKERNIKTILEKHEAFFEMSILADANLYARYLDADFEQGDFERIIYLLEEQLEIYCELEDFKEDYIDLEEFEDDENYDEFGVINYYRELENKLMFYDKRENYFSTNWVELTAEDLDY